MPETRKEPFFTRNRSFYRALFTLLITLALQNLIAYSVNMADNIMLGSYSQPALSGAAAVNQIFFIVQQLTLGIGDGLVILAARPLIRLFLGGDLSILAIAVPALRISAAQRCMAAKRAELRRISR